MGGPTITTMTKTLAFKNLTDLNKHKFISYGKGAPSPVFNPDWALKIGNKDDKK
mgnify:CR=1 FL=1